MTIATLAQVLALAVARRRAVAGLVVLGWEDARAYVEAAEAVGAPLILQAGPGCRRHTPTPILGAMFRRLAEGALVPVACHIDHATTVEECREGIESGFTSVMIDGSALALRDNMALTRDVVELAHRHGVSVEGEVGVVGYSDGAPSAATDPEEAAQFERATGVDALAVSVGNVHLSRDPSAHIDDRAIAAIAAATRVPLVIHGGSGVPASERRRLSADRRVAKFNIGTELRQAFGHALRAQLAANPAMFDRNEILRGVEPDLRRVAAEIIENLWRL